MNEILKLLSGGDGKVEFTFKWDLVSSLVLGLSLGFFMFLGVVAGRKV